MRTAFARCLLLCLVGSVARSAPVQAATSYYSYWVNALPANLGSCEAAEQYVAPRFTATSGLPVFRIECDAHHPPTAHADLSYDVRVFYRAERVLRSVAVGVDIGIDAEGTYGSFDECNADLQAQLALFAKATQLKPTVGYCYMTRYLSSFPWEVHIDAFGMPAQYPQRYDAIVSFSFVENRNELADTVKSKLEAQGIFVRSLDFIYMEPDGTHLNVNYYATQPIAFHSWDAVIPDQDSCEYEQSTIEAVFAADSYAPLTTFCAQRGVSDWNVVVLAQGDWPYQTTDLPFTYANLQECHAAIPDVVRGYEDTNGLTVHGAFCGGEAGGAVHIVLLKA